MKINCIACGHNFELDEAYHDYEGPVSCWVCGTPLEIMTVDGGIRRIRLPGGAQPVNESRAEAGARVAKEA